MAEAPETFFTRNGIVDISSKDLLSWIFDEPRYSKDDAIYIDADTPSRSLTITTAKSLVKRLIAGFRASSLVRGDCICVHSFNDLYYSCIVLAAIGAGLIWTGTNPAYTPSELQHHLTVSKAKLVLVQPELYDSISQTAKACGIKEPNVLIFDALSNGNFSPKSWNSLLCHGEQDWIRFDELNCARSTIACLLFSSGTTGLPKAASVSHYNLIAQHTLLQEQVQKPYQVKRILCLPFFHAAMAIMAHVTPLRSGHIAYVMRRFDLESFLRYTEKYEITELFVVPPIVVSILQSPLTKRFSLKSLRCGMTGGAKIDLLSQKSFTALMHRDGCLNPCYGMTELSCIGACYSWPNQDIDGSIGHFLPNLEVKLVDDEGKEIRAFNARGELWIRGPTVIEGYYKNPEANASAFTNGWFHTGDIAYCDANTKKWYIVDRKKELIKVRGFQVAPPEIEAVLMSHPLIIDAAVIGVPATSPVDGESPRAYIIRSPTSKSSVSEAQIHQYLSERLASYKQLKGGIVFLTELPKTASGKYLKRYLRDRYKQETGTPHTPKL